MNIVSFSLLEGRGRTSYRHVPPDRLWGGSPFVDVIVFWNEHRAAERFSEYFLNKPSIRERPAPGLWLHPKLAAWDLGETAANGMPFVDFCKLVQANCQPGRKPWLGRVILSARSYILQLCVRFFPEQRGPLIADARRHLSGFP